MSATTARHDRNSALELLRIVGMIMIVATHTNHAKFNFPIDSISINRLWQQFLSMGGGLGNGIFVIISGYFLVKSKSLNFRKLFNLWIRMFFYSVVIYVLFVSFGATDFGIRATIRSLMPVTRNTWWFASTYFVMYLIHPYVNILLHSFNRDDYRKFLVAIFLYWSIIPMITKSPFQSNGLIEFTCMYSLAGYVRLWSDDFGSRKFIFYGVGFIALNYASIIIFDIIGLKLNRIGRNAAYLNGMMRPLIVCATLCLFIGFKHLNITRSRIINTIAAATFGVYLIHDNNFVRPFLWLELFKNASYQDSPYLIPYSIAVIFVVYISCTAIELARSRIFRLISSGRLS